LTEIVPVIEGYYIILRAEMLEKIREKGRERKREREKIKHKTH
jgi:hypothetical protein